VELDLGRARRLAGKFQAPGRSRHPCLAPGGTPPGALASCGCRWGGVLEVAWRVELDLGRARRLAGTFQAPGNLQDIA